MPDIKVKINHGGSQTINAEVKRSLKLKNQDKIITKNGIYTADVGYTGLGIVTVDINAGEKDGATTNTFLGDVDENGVLQFPTKQTELVFTGVKDVASSGLYQKFYKLNIKKVSFLDLTTITGQAACQGTLNGCAALTNASFPKLTTITGQNACYQMFYDCTALTDISFPSLTDITGSASCANMFYGCTTLKDISFPNLTNITGQNACQYMFRGCTALTNVSFPDLTTITGKTSCQSMFRDCTALTNASFQSLTTITGQSVFSQIFYGCTALTDISFPSLTTTSFGSTYTNQIQYLLSYTGNSVQHTIHFPSNMESTISKLSGYPNFGGTSKFVVLAFDLPPTI